MGGNRARERPRGTHRHTAVPPQAILRCQRSRSWGSHAVGPPVLLRTQAAIVEVAAVGRPRRGHLHALVRGPCESQAAQPAERARRVRSYTLRASFTTRRDDPICLHAFRPLDFVHFL